MRKLRGLFYLFWLFTFPLCGKAQEMNARIVVNGDKVAVANKQLFTTLQNALTEFINNRRWTDATFSVNERIDCTMTIIINELNETGFKGEIQVQARRPVYNSSYTTTLLNFRDKQLEFEYAEGEPLEYNESVLTSNLTATIVFYTYLILGLDSDSFAPKGGNTCFQQAWRVVNRAQSEISWTGWKAFDSNQNRHAVITALQDNTSDTFREMWYTYHRKGLDEMALNADRGRATTLGTLPALQEVKRTRPASVILQMFADTKLDELIAVCSKATSQERQEGYKILFDLYPTQGSRLDELKKSIR